MFFLNLFIVRQIRTNIKINVNKIDHNDHSFSVDFNPDSSNEILLNKNPDPSEKNIHISPCNYICFIKNMLK